MKLKSYLTLVIVLSLSSLIWGQSTPKTCTFSASNLVIPWNASSVTGTIRFNYYDFSADVSALEYVKMNGANLSIGSELLPSSATFTVTQPGSYTFTGQMSYRTGSGSSTNYYYTYPPDLTITVTKEPLPSYTLTVESNDYGGYVYVNGQAISGTATFTFTHGTSVSLDASYSFWINGTKLYKFSQWSDGELSRSRTIIMDSNKYLMPLYYCSYGCDPGPIEP